MDFEWDEGNIRHITGRNIAILEVEESLLDPQQVDALAYDVDGEHREARIGRTHAGRLLFVVYTERDDGSVRPLQARDVNRRDQRAYENR